MWGLFGKKEEVEDLTPVSVHEFPKTEYNAYWEILLEGGPGNYISTVRVYPKEGPVKMKTIRASSSDLIAREQNKYIRETMQEFKK
jgi:hypothetical protein